MSKREQQSATHESIATPVRTKQLMARHGFTLKKSLGQNFLVDGNTLDRIVDVAQLVSTSGVLEIGPGAGSLTQKLAQVVRKVVAVEIDQRVLPLLQESLSSHANVAVIHGDILKIDLEDVWRTHFTDCTEVSVVANLPYYITTPIVLAMLEYRQQLRQLVIMMQKEVAERIVAQPGTKDYGSLSIAVQYYCEARELLRVPRTVFLPPPNVDSSVLGVFMREKPAVDVQSESLFFEVVRASFTQRRKTISNNLLQHYKSQYSRTEIDKFLVDCQIAPIARAESLTMADFARLANHLTTL